MMRGVANATLTVLAAQVRALSSRGRHAARWVVLGAVAGVLAGLASAAFLEVLDWATRTRTDNRALIFGLPLAGLLTGLAHRYAPRASRGNNLILEEIHAPRAWIPRRMAPLVFSASVLTHLFGGSAGREGAATQMAVSLTDGFSRLARLRPPDRRLLLIAGIAGGFGAVFGVPFAGCIFALEVQPLGRVRFDAVLPALSASIVGDLVVRGLGVEHTPLPRFGDVDMSAALLVKTALAAVCFGAAAAVFGWLTGRLRRLFVASIRWAPARPVAGGVIVVALTYVVGSHAYLGLSLPLATGSLAGGAAIGTLAFALKLIFTSVTLGSGFFGGEVTPLFVIGATLGATMGKLLDTPVGLLAAVGFVAVFAAAANTPVACTVMGVEMFGGDMFVLLAVGCLTACVVSPRRGIYSVDFAHADRQSTEPFEPACPR